MKAEVKERKVITEVKLNLNLETADEVESFKMILTYAELFMQHENMYEKRFVDTDKVYSMIQELKGKVK